MLKKLVLKKIVRKKILSLSKIIKLWRANANFQENKKISLRIDHDITSNQVNFIIKIQALTVVALEKDINKKNEEVNHILRMHKLQKILFNIQMQYTNSLTLFWMRWRNNILLSKFDNQLVLEEPEKLPKKNLQLSLEPFEEKKANQPLSQITEITSTGSQNQNIQISMGINSTATIAEAKDYLEFSNTGEMIQKEEPEEPEDEDDGMTYLMSAEEKVY